MQTWTVAEDILISSVKPKCSAKPPLNSALEILLPVLTYCTQLRMQVSIEWIT